MSLSLAFIKKKKNTERLLCTGAVVGSVDVTVIKINKYKNTTCVHGTFILVSFPLSTCPLMPWSFVLHASCIFFYKESIIFQISITFCHISFSTALEFQAKILFLKVWGGEKKRLEGRGLGCGMIRAIIWKFPLHSRECTEWDSEWKSWQPDP